MGAGRGSRGNTIFGKSVVPKFDFGEVVIRMELGDPFLIKNPDMSFHGITAPFMKITAQSMRITAPVLENYCTCFGKLLHQ